MLPAYPGYSGESRHGQAVLINGSLIMKFFTRKGAEAKTITSLGLTEPDNETLRSTFQSKRLNECWMAFEGGVYLPGRAHPKLDPA